MKNKELKIEENSTDKLLKEVIKLMKEILAKMDKVSGGFNEL